MDVTETPQSVAAGVRGAGLKRRTTDELLTSRERGGVAPRAFHFYGSHLNALLKGAGCPMLDTEIQIIQYISPQKINNEY